MRFLFRYPLVVILAWAIWCPLALAQDGQDEGLTEGSIYIPMEPPFVVNYGGAGRLKYLKADLALRVQDVHTASAVRHHMPLIRNAMVMLLSRQSEESVTTTNGTEHLRQAAKEEIIRLLKAEHSAAEVLDVYFNNLIVQK